MSIQPRLADRTYLALVFAVLCVLLCAVPAGLQAQNREAAPEAATGWMGQTLATAKTQMVSAANPDAVEAGLEILRAGGNAADAAIAVQLVLNLMEPQSSGIGGGSFILHWNAERKELKSYDGRETAPQAARPDRFLVEGQPRDLEDAIFGGLSVGVPGTLRALELLHKQQEPSCRGARLFACHQAGLRRLQVPPRLHLLLRWYGADSFSLPGPPLFLRPEPAAPSVGLSAQNPEFAAALRAIAGAGRTRSAGAGGRAIVQMVRTAPTMRATSRSPISRVTAPRSASRCAPFTARIRSAAWVHRPAASP
jgi:gamma-glutamyltranspeptidase/glutathione hydrolase